MSARSRAKASTSGPRGGDGDAAKSAAGADDDYLRRVLAGGLAAGLVISLGALAMVPVVGEQMDAALRERGVPPLSAGAMAYFIIQSFTYGVVLLWL